MPLDIRKTGLYKKGVRMDSERLQELSTIIWRVLRSMPITILDDDSEQVLENELWELVDERLEGDYAGSRIIGSANLVTAFILVQQKRIAKNPNSESTRYIFDQALEYLEKERFIRRKPEKLRQTFKAVK